MADPWDEFFIGKVKEGLAHSAESLSSEEENCLRSAVSDIATNPAFTPENGQALQIKCMSALTSAYVRDTGGKDKQRALQWRENNEALYKYSRLVISGIVQSWYLSVGRTLEKKATRWSASNRVIVAFLFSLVGILFGLFAWIALVMAIMSLREMKRSGDSSKKGLAVAAAFIGGIWGPVRSLLSLIAKSGILQ